MGAKDYSFTNDLTNSDNDDGATSNRFLEPEVKAFIYQQISAFNQFFTDDTNMSVILIEEGSATEPMVLKLKLSALGSSIEAEGKGEDVFGAIIDAKGRLLETLNHATREAIEESENKSSEALLEDDDYKH